AGHDGSSWPQAYLKAFQACKQPVWVPGTNLEPSAVIDGFIERGWSQRHVQPSPPADDRTFVRRVYLDLAGRIPTPAEREALFAEVRPDKRARLVEQILSGKDYPRRMREVFDAVLMERRDENAENQRRDHGWFEYLEHAFASNYSWDKI